MIVDSIKNIDLYKNSVHKNLYRYLEFMKNSDINSIPLEQRLAIDGNSYYIINEIKSKRPEETFWESHKKYIDIHYILEGTEAIAYNYIENMKVKTPYNAEKDLIVYENEDNNNITNKVELCKNMFMVLTPNDAHMSNLYIKESSLFKKFLFKVAI